MTASSTTTPQQLDLRKPKSQRTKQPLLSKAPSATPPTSVSASAKDQSLVGSQKKVLDLKKPKKIQKPSQDNEASKATLKIVKSTNNNSPKKCAADRVSSKLERAATAAAPFSQKPADIPKTPRHKTVVESESPGLLANLHTPVKSQHTGLTPRKSYRNPNGSDSPMKFSSPNDRVFWATSPPSKFLQRAALRKGAQNQADSAASNDSDLDDIVKLLGCTSSQLEKTKSSKMSKSESSSKDPPEDPSKTEASVENEPTDVEGSSRKSQISPTARRSPSSCLKSDTFKRSHSFNGRNLSETKFPPPRLIKRQRQHFGEDATTDPDRPVPKQKPKPSLFELIGKVHTVFSPTHGDGRRRKLKRASTQDSIDRSGFETPIGQTPIASPPPPLPLPPQPQPQPPSIVPPASIPLQNTPSLPAPSTALMRPPLPPTFKSNLPSTSIPSEAVHHQPPPSPHSTLISRNNPVPDFCETNAPATSTDGACGHHRKSPIAQYVHPRNAPRSPTTSDASGAPNIFGRTRPPEDLPAPRRDEAKLYTDYDTTGLARPPPCDKLADAPMTDISRPEREDATDEFDNVPFDMFDADFLEQVDETESNVVDKFALPDDEEFEYDPYEPVPTTSPHPASTTAPVVDNFFPIPQVSTLDDELEAVLSMYDTADTTVVDPNPISDQFKGAPDDFAFENVDAAWSEDDPQIAAALAQYDAFDASGAIDDGRRDGDQGPNAFEDGDIIVGDGTGTGVADPARFDDFNEYSDFDYDPAMVDVAGLDGPALDSKPQFGAPAQNSIVDEFDQITSGDLDALLADFDDGVGIGAHLDATSTVVPKKYDRYVVTDVAARWKSDGTGGRHEKVLRLKDEKKNEMRWAVLTEEWYFTEVAAGDHVHIIAPLDRRTRCHTLTNDSGYLVLHPDCLISATSLSEAPTCSRRSVLSDRVRAVGGQTQSMIFGTLLHEVIQTALRTDDFSTDGMEREMVGVLMRGIEGLWCVGVDEESARKWLREAGDGVRMWADKFVRKSPRKDAIVTEHRTPPGNLPAAPICIGAVIDIEETLWSPMYGLKGNIDATVEIRRNAPPPKRDFFDVRPKKKNLTKSAAPLEIKTGKSTTHMAHRAQTMLYALMMSDRYDVEVDAGFLYYTQSSDFIRVPAARNEIRGLLNIRNEMATYVKSRKQLPEMKRSMHVCQRCYSLDTCLVYHKMTEGGTAETSNLGSLFDSKTEQINDVHVRFFQKFEAYLAAEESDMFNLRREIWCMTGPEREKLGRCISGLTIVEEDPYDAPSSTPAGMFGKFTYQLHRSRSAATTLATPLTPATASSGFLASRLTLGDAIVISTEADHYALATGLITAMEPDRITVTVNRPLLGAPEPSEDFDPAFSQAFRPVVEIETDGDVVPNGHRRASPVSVLRRMRRDSKCEARAEEHESARLFRVDKDEMAGGMNLVRGNLVQLFTEGGDEKRRRLVVENEAPKFKALEETDGFEGGGISWNGIVGLNEDQKRAIEKVLTAMDYTLILGMPGTGKTTTISALVRILVARGKSVLLTSYTHTAVDNILIKLKEAGIGFLRLGNVDKIHSDIKPFTPNYDGSVTTVAQLDTHLMSKPVVATNCLGIGHVLFTKRTFDYCIVDEASQITLPACLGPLRFADIFVLVGDHHQLPPLVRHPEAAGLSVSLFKTLSQQHPDSVVTLEHQYRMPHDIMLLSNTLVYDERLKCGSEDVGSRMLDLPVSNGFEASMHRRLQVSQLGGFGLECDGGDDCWLRAATDPSRRVIFLDTDAVPAPESRPVASIVNETEAILVHHLTEALLACGIAETSIGIISPHRAQLKGIAHALACRPAVEIHTVDKYQGRDKDCVIVSLVRSNDEKQIGDLLNDKRRLNVALTRAKRKLVIIGSRRTLMGSDMFRKLFGILDRHRWVYSLPADAHRLHAVGRDLPSA